MDLSATLVSVENVSFEVKFRVAMLAGRWDLNPPSVGNAHPAEWNKKVMNI